MFLRKNAYATCDTNRAKHCKCLQAQLTTHYPDCNKIIYAVKLSSVKRLYEEFKWQKKKTLTFQSIFVYIAQDGLLKVMIGAKVLPVHVCDTKLFS